MPPVPPIADQSISKSATAARTVAAIDVGANSIRMVIAEVMPDGHIEVLERLQRAVRLGQDTFRRGRMGAASMRAAVAVLRDYQQLLGLYKVERVRAVATSAAREASNADTFLDRILMATGLRVEVIGTSEESRLTVSAVRPAVGDALGVNKDESLIADVGGGSTLLTLLNDGEIVTSQSLRLGSIRLQEMLSTSEDSPQRSAEMLRYHIANVLAAVQSSLPLRNVRSFVAVGGDARFAARQIGRPTDSEDLVVIEPQEFDKLVDRCEEHTAEELSKRHGLPFAEAETVNPALLVYQNLLRLTRATQMIVSHVSMRDGLLLELARAVTGEEDKTLLEGVIHSAVAVAKRYRVDMKHARNVADVAIRLFDELHAEHGLGPRQRLLLEVAGLLHEVGGFVSSRSHHKHSYYIIANSEIFGLNRDEIAIVAQVARYHRRSGPKPSHVEYMALSRETRVVVNKLAALLRVADALARGHIREARDLRFERQGDDLVVYIPGVSDILLEERAIAGKGDLFEDIYGMKVRLETA
jgi:exopolyphosphatase/guanosine-5'-triphosphate,3'-diphosphate pyrophosphatase